MSDLGHSYNSFSVSSICRAYTWRLYRARCIGLGRENRGPMSQQMKHDNDPYLHYGHKGPSPFMVTFQYEQ